MSELRVASRYAKSLLELAAEQGVLEEVHADMISFHKVCTVNRDFYLMLKNPIIKHDKKLAILKAIFSDKVNKLTLAIFDIITRKNRESILDAIAKEFHLQYNIYKGVEVAQIVSAVPLGKDIKAKIEALVSKISSFDKVELEEKVDEDLIGGYILTVGDRQIDDSIKSKLKALELEFTHNPYIKEF